MKKLSEFWNNSSRVTRIMFWVLMIIGVTLMVCSFILPPVGDLYAKTFRPFAGLYKDMRVS